MIEYVWSGPEANKPLEALFCFEPPTDEELAFFRKKEEEDLKLDYEERKQEEKEKRRKKYEEKQKAQNVPLAPLPERPLCDYEKIRENNIKEREAAMKAAGFYSDFSELEKSI